MTTYYSIATDTWPENQHDFGIWVGAEGLDDAIQEAWLEEASINEETGQYDIYGLGLPGHDSGFRERLTKLGLTPLEITPIRLILED